MNVTLVSAFRNAVGAIPRYFAQIDALAKILAQRTPYTRLSLILGYGDSTDGTGEVLFEAAADSIGALLMDVSHGGKEYGSIEHPERFKQLAYVGNKLWGNLAADADVVILCESDLIWEPQTMVRLLDDLVHVPCVAPMVMDGPQSFYDVFAFRRNGVRFTKTPPYHAELNGELLRVDSAGSVLVMRGELARQVRFSEEAAIVGLCESITQKGGEIYVDPAASVCHP